MMAGLTSRYLPRPNHLSLPCGRFSPAPSVWVGYQTPSSQLHILSARRRLRPLAAVPPPSQMDANEEVLMEVPTFLRTYKSGRVERLKGTEVVPPGVDPSTGTASKDVMIQPETGVSARLFLPSLTDSSKNKEKLPILVYIHGGGFCIESPFSPPYHNYLNSLAYQANIVAVSVHYRLAPEHPVPTCYDDSWMALEWVASHAGGKGPEPWLAEYGDLGRVFLAGDSAGANIVHNISMRASALGLGPGVRIKGLVLVHPFFWGSEPVGSEMADSPGRATTEKMWSFVCPSTPGIDDPLINPMAEGAPSLARLPCERVLVCVGEKDFLCDRGRAYYEALKGSGWEGEVELLESQEENHVFHLFNPGGENAVAMMGRLVDFFNHD